MPPAMNRLLGLQDLRPLLVKTKRFKSSLKLSRWGPRPGSLGLNLLLAVIVLDLILVAVNLILALPVVVIATGPVGPLEVVLALDARPGSVHSPSSNPNLPKFKPSQSSNPNLDQELVLEVRPPMAVSQIWELVVMVTSLIQLLLSFKPIPIFPLYMGMLFTNLVLIYFSSLIFIP